MKNSYQTKDLYLAAYLYSEGLELKDTKKIGGVCWFIFTDESKCEDLVNLYWRNQAISKIKSFTDSIRTLKDLIYSN